MGTYQPSRTGVPWEVKSPRAEKESLSVGLLGDVHEADRVAGSRGLRPEDADVRSDPPVAEKPAGDEGPILAVASALPEELVRPKRCGVVQIIAMPLQQALERGNLAPGKTSVPVSVGFLVEFREARVGDPGRFPECGLPRCLGRWLSRTPAPGVPASRGAWTWRVPRAARACTGRNSQPGRGERESGRRDLRLPGEGRRRKTQR